MSPRGSVRRADPEPKAGTLTDYRYWVQKKEPQINADPAEADSARGHSNKSLCNRRWCRSARNTYAGRPGEAHLKGEPHQVARPNSVSICAYRRFLPLSFIGGFFVFARPERWQQTNETDRDRPSCRSAHGTWSTPSPCAGEGIVDILPNAEDFFRRFGNNAPQPTARGD